MLGHAADHLRLNTVSTSSSSFLVNISLLHTEQKPIKISALLDSSLSHCFINSSLVSAYDLPTSSMHPPLQLCVTIRRSEKLGHSAKLMACPLAHSCPLARHFRGLREVLDIEKDQRRLVEGKGVSRSLG